MREYTYKENVIEDVIEFCDAKETENEERMTKAADRIFAYNMFIRRFFHGSASRSYNFFGVKQLEFVYEGVTKEEWCQAILEHTKTLFCKHFKADKGSIDSEPTARKMINKFLSLYMPNAYMTLTIERAKELEPEKMERLSYHYLQLYISKMRKKGLELTDYDINNPESMEQMMKDTGIHERSCYQLFSAFGLVSKAEANAIQLKAIGVNNSDCNSQYLYAYKSARKRVDFDNYDLTSDIQVSDLATAAGWTINKCRKIIDDLKLSNNCHSKEPKKKVLDSTALETLDYESFVFE